MKLGKAKEEGGEWEKRMKGRQCLFKKIEEKTRERKKKKRGGNPKHNTSE